MNHTIEILKTVLPVLLMLGVGMVCRQKNILTREGVGALKSVAVNIALPAVMINAFATMEYTLANVLLALLMFGVCAAAWVLGRVLAPLLKMESRFVPFLTTGFEAGMLGYALFIMLYGADRTADFACVDLGQVMFVFTLYKILLGLNGEEKPTACQLIGEMFRSPTIIAIAVGLLLGATGLYAALEPSGISSVIDACTNFVSAPTSCLILISIGYDLVLKDISWLATLKVTALRIFVMLVLRLGVGALLPVLRVDPSLANALNVMFILPPPFVLPIFAEDESQQVYISSALSMSTLVTILGFIVLAVTGGA